MSLVQLFMQLQQNASIQRGGGGGVGLEQ